jgi:hypothetical protein
MTVKYGQSLGYVNQIRMKCSPTVKSLVINVMNKSDNNLLSLIINKLYCLKAILLNCIFSKARDSFGGGAAPDKKA